MILGINSEGFTIVTFFASFLIWIMFGGLVALWVFDGKVTKEQALHAFFAAVVAWVVTQMIKEFFPTTRPFMINGNSPLTLTIPGDGSFPSSHAAVAFALSMSVYLHDRKVGMIFLVSALLVSIGRVLGNVHYSFDVVVGAILGMTVGLLVDKIHFHNLVKKFK